MDRIDAMKVFVTALDEGSLAGAGRKLGRSPAAVSRAVAFLEDHVGVQLLHRTTRSSKLSEVGERYAAACRRLLIDLDEVEILAASERTHPGGTLSLTAPVLSGEQVLRPILDDFLDAFPMVSAKLLQAASSIGRGSGILASAATSSRWRLRAITAPTVTTRPRPLAIPSDCGN